MINPLTHIKLLPLTGLSFIFLLYLIPATSQTLTFVELNCENLFDFKHDSLKQDNDFLPDAPRHWTPKRYWRKLNNIAQNILSCSEVVLPDLVALVEVENDSVLTDLTRRSLLNNAGYKYLMTQSPDLRGVDVALLYQPYTFSPIYHESLRISPLKGMRPTRDILYVKGRFISGDTLHIFVLHAPSRFGGKRVTQPYRVCVAKRLCSVVDSLRRFSPQSHVIVAGDFNDYANDVPLRILLQSGLSNITVQAKGKNGARGTYRYKGKWGSIDHVFVSASLLPSVCSAYINDALFLLEDDERYGGYKPRRTYTNFHYQSGYSDHLPLVVQLHF